MLAQLLWSCIWAPRFLRGLAVNANTSPKHASWVAWPNTSDLVDCRYLIPGCRAGIETVSPMECERASLFPVHRDGMSLSFPHFSCGSQESSPRNWSQVGTGRKLSASFLPSSHESFLLTASFPVHVFLPLSFSFLLSLPIFFSVELLEWKEYGGTEKTQTRRFFILRRTIWWYQSCNPADPVTSSLSNRI